MKSLKSAYLFFISFTSFVSLSCMADESTGDKASQQKISSIIRDSAAKINRLDVEGGLEHIHPTAYSEYTHLPQKPLVAIDKKTLVGICKAIFPSLKIKRSPAMNLKVVVKGDMAYATFDSKSQLADSPPMTVRHTEIFVRENKAWLLIHSHRSILSGE